MKKMVIFICAILILAIAVVDGDVQPVDDLAINEECTIGVYHASVTTHDGPVLWKVADKALTEFPEGACGIVRYYDHEEWGTEYNFIGTTSTWEGLPPQNRIGAGLNEAGVGSGNTFVEVEGYSNQSQVFLFHVIGNFGEISEIRAYIESPLGKTEFSPSGCFPFIDNSGNASMFELDPSTETIWEYNTMAPARKSQGLQGFVVRANEFHKQPSGRDDTSINGRYLVGTENTLGLIALGELDEQSVAQSDSNEVYRLVRQNSYPDPISYWISQGATIIRGVAPGEDPSLAMMWVLGGNPSFSIAVPTWVAVSEIPEPIGTCEMYNTVTSLFNEETSLKGKWDKAEWVQQAVLPAEAHLFDMVNERLLPHWRSLGGPPAVEEMTRVEHQMVEDAYSVVNYLTTGYQNMAPTVDFVAQSQAGFTYSFTAEAADAEGSVVSYLWNFGDSTTSTDVSPVHEFPGAGAYLVSVTVADDDGVTTTAWRYLTVE